MEEMEARYKEKIIEMLKEIDKVDILIRIYTVVDTHLKMIKGEI